MRNLYFAITLTFFFHSVYAQDYSQKFGRITDYELKMETYDPEPAANAVVLYENQNIYFEVNSGFQLVKEYSVKIKVLTSEGTDRGDVVIPFYTTNTLKEQVTGIDAYSYNIENGKVEKTQLKRQMIFREKVNDRVTTVKFSIPNVKAGSVIEYKYKINSDLFFNIPEIEVQKDIPVVSMTAELRIPEWFRFRINSQGYYSPKVERSNITENFVIGMQSLSTPSSKIIITGENIPMIKSEPYVWYHRDFLAKVTFEIAGVYIPGTFQRTFNNSWGDVNRHLSESEFARSYKMNCPFKDEVKKIVREHEDPLARIRAIHRYVVTKVKWNETYNLLGSNARSALKDGVGSSSDINFLIMSGLLEAGFSPEPLLLRPRSLGRLPLTHPTLEHIRTFVIAVPLDDGRAALLDGTDPYSDVNVLPPNLVVDMARLYTVDDESGWVDLTAFASNFTKYNVMAVVDENGSVRVQQWQIMDGADAMEFKKKYHSFSDEEKLKEDYETRNLCRVEEMNIQGLDSTVVVASFVYDMDLEKISGDMLIRSTLFPIFSENPFSEQERQLPIEFPKYMNVEVSCFITLPEGYEVTDKPDDVMLTACNDAVQITFLSQVQGQNITTRLVLRSRKLVFTVDEYPDLVAFFDHVTEICGSKFVLKKSR